MSKSITDNVLLSAKALKRLPKVELHRHLDGSTRPQTIIDLAREQGVKIPTENLDELRKLICVDSKECNSLEDYLVGFSVVQLVLQKPYAITRVMFEVCEDAALDGVRYLEVRFSPVLHIDEGLSFSAVMDAICEGLEMAEYHLPITVRIIVCGMRQLPSSTTKDLAEIAWRYRHKGVVGFDLAGPESGFSSKNHAEAFSIIRSKCINVTLHSGEAAGWESIQDSIRYCGANRLGHGVRLIENPDLMQYVINHSIAIEICPTSNIHTKAIAKLEDHPIRKYFDAGAIVVPCCDNTTVSSVLLSGEYKLLQTHFNFTPLELVQLVDYGYQAAFVNSTQKRRFRAEAIKDCIAILKEEGLDISPILKHPQFYHLVPNSSPDDLMWTVNPPLTIDIIKALPKADLHCRLAGSVSLGLVWKELKDAGIDTKSQFGITFKTEQDLYSVLKPAQGHTPESRALARSITKSVLQTASQLQRAVHDIISQAVADRVVYMELAVRPNTHIVGGLTPSRALDIVLEEKSKLEATLPIKVGVIVYASAGQDDPIQFKKMAKLAVVRKSHGVCGFGFHGDDIAPADYPFFASTFDYLKMHHLNFVMTAGNSEVGSVVKAIQEGGANRISGGFLAHTFPRLMNYMATLNIPVELGNTDKLELHTKEIKTFASSPIRLFIDNGIPVTICTFTNALNDKTRADMIHSIIQECNLTAPDAIMLLSHGFMHNFQPHDVRHKMYKDFYNDITSILTAKGFKHLFKVPLTARPNPAVFAHMIENAKLPN
eukprot:Phypoly_transcript_03435.p1 GENE.Phypoly_transcript_03435~~Phypoly_transcript_03435.p1  ORF type:complete len:770 (+),score=83.44 Phypoly_transcript_03435:62-2371(+)